MTRSTKNTKKEPEYDFDVDTVDTTEDSALDEIEGIIANDVDIDVSLPLDKALAKYTDEDLVDYLSRRGFTPEALMNHEIQKQADAEQKKRSAKTVVITDEAQLTVKQKYSEKATFTVYNKNTKCITEVNGVFAKNEARNPDYHIRFKHFETREAV